MINPPDHFGMYWVKDISGTWAIVEVNGEAPFLHIDHVYVPGFHEGFSQNKIVEFGYEIIHPEIRKSAEVKND